MIPFSFESSMSIMPFGDFVKLNASETTGAIYTGKTYINENQSKISTVYIFPTDDNSEIDYYIDSTQTNDFEKGINNSENDNFEQSDYIKNSIKQGYIEQNNDVKIALPTQIPSETVKAQSNNDNVQRNGTDNSISEDYYVSTSNNIFGYPAKYFWGIIAYLWLFGVVAIMGYALVGYIHMKQITAASMKLEDLILSESVVSRFKIKLENVYICDRLDTAFIFGIIHPRIYLPSNLDETQIENVIAHEHVHIMRRDYIWKLIGFLMLAVYWFNPLVWLAYAFLCRDIEFACDEQVISGMSTGEVKRYSETLLYCSTNLQFMYGCPLAFGEIAVKDRVKAALNYKKPGFWIFIIALSFCVILGIVFLTKNTDLETDSQIIDQRIFDEIYDSPCAKFEYVDEKEQVIFITSEIKTLSGAFKSLVLIQSNKKQDSEGWIYRITFNCHEKMINADEIVVLIGTDGMSVNGKNYCTPETVPFAKVMDVFESKYRYFKNNDDSLEKVQPDQSEVAAGEDVVVSRTAVLNTYCEITSAKELMETISDKFKYGFTYEFDYTYVVPDGTEFGEKFRYSSGRTFIDYIKKWPDLSRIECDPDMIASLKDTRESENGYLIVSTNDEYEGDEETGYRLYIKDGYIHVFSDNGQVEKYMWSYKFKDGFKPNMYNFRRMLFDSKMYETYVQHCNYEKISGTGIYNVNRGYLIDLDGDGQDERLFVAACGWINYPEPENKEDMVDLGVYHETNAPLADKNYPGSFLQERALIFVNGKLWNEKEYEGSNEIHIQYAFAITDTDLKDGRYEILIQNDPSDLFYVWKDGALSGPKAFGGIMLISEYGKMNSYIDVSVSGEFHGDGTFTGGGTISLPQYGYSMLSQNVTWYMDSDGNIERRGNIFDIFCYNEKMINKIADEEEKEMFKKRILEHPEDYYLKLEVGLDVSKDQDGSSRREHLLPGYVMIDCTDGVSMIHLTSPYTGISGWIDLANLEEYVPAYKDSGLEGIADTDKMDALFSNINHAG